MPEYPTNSAYIVSSRLQNIRGRSKTCSSVRPAKIATMRAGLNNSNAIVFSMGTIAVQKESTSTRALAPGRHTG